MRLKGFHIFNSNLANLPREKSLITTINAHSFNLSISNSQFCEALLHSEILLPDGISIVWAKRFLDGTKLKKIAGADLFAYEMQQLNDQGGTCFFLGSTNDVLEKIKNRAAKEFPNVKVNLYSPPFKSEFAPSENKAIIDTINDNKPDVLFVGMTAPKQEIWAYIHKDKIEARHICCIGAVFDFYAGTVKRAPNWIVKIGLEWMYRLIKEPKRLWKRYLIGNTIFIISILKEKLRLE